MQELLFITPDELAKTTILGGNVDRDKYTFSILNVQKTVIERLLGTELYDKIINDIENQTLTGLFLLNDLEINDLIDFQINAHYTTKTIAGHGGESRDLRLKEFLIINNEMKVLGLPEGKLLELDGDKWYLKSFPGLLTWSNNESDLFMVWPAKRVNGADVQLRAKS